MINKTLLLQLGIYEEVNKYIKVLINNNIKPKTIILFGSFAKNTTREYSDIDLAVITDKFAKDEIEEIMALSRFTIGVSDRIEAIPLREKYLQSKYHPLIGEIKKYGKTVYNS